MNRPLLLILFVLALGCLALFLRQLKSPVEPREFEAPKAIDYGLLIETAGDQASRRNLNAFRSFELELNRVIAKHSKGLDGTIGEASSELASYDSCCQIIFFLAYDGMTRSSKTQEHMDGKLNPVLIPAIDALILDVDDALDQLKADLDRSTLQMASDLAGLAKEAPGDGVTVSVDDLSHGDLEKALINLGISGAVTMISSTITVVGLANSELIRLAMTKVKEKAQELAEKIFKKQAAKAGASVAAAAADGPVPVGDIIAVVGLLWTGYEVKKGRSDFENEIAISLRNMMEESHEHAHQQAVENANRLLRSFQELQDGIGTEFLTKLSE